MTWENNVEVEFTHNDQEYCASADVTVTMSKQDIGPSGYSDHVYSYVTDDVECKNLMVGDLEVIPEDLRRTAEEVIGEVASMRAEESMW
jgi:hypothetical protein